jgi:hypothetical protein
MAATTERKEVPAREHYQISMQSKDIALPRLRIVSNQSDHFKAGRFKEGDIVVGIASDDPEAERLYEYGSKDCGVVFHVLDMHTFLSGEKGGQLWRWDIGDPEAPSDARTTYEYTMCVPAYDEMLPVLYTFSPGSSRVAQGINAAILRQQQSGPPWGLAFSMTSAMKSRDRYTWAAPVVVAVEPNAGALKAADAMGTALTASVPKAIEEVSTY